MSAWHGPPVANPPGGTYWPTTPSVASDASEFVGRLVDLRGPKSPNAVVPTHVIADAQSVWLEDVVGIRITAYHLRDGTRGVFTYRFARKLMRRCV